MPWMNEGVCVKLKLVHTEMNFSRYLKLVMLKYHQSAILLFSNRPDKESMKRELTDKGKKNLFLPCKCPFTNGHNNQMDRICWQVESTGYSQIKSI